MKFDGTETLITIFLKLKIAFLCYFINYCTHLIMDYRWKFSKNIKNYEFRNEKHIKRTLTKR